jgi:hypothetical protein
VVEKLHKAGIVCMNVRPAFHRSPPFPSFHRSGQY